jgi:predicted unusual protein kinase regulating ubiquinone biosynthesis (AarF/ABC1/UbiB family)
VQFVRELGDVLFEMPFQIPESFILLGRCVSILSGICSGLDADFNIWQQIVPYARRLVDDQRGGSLNWVLGEVGDTLRIAASLPRRAEELFNRLESGRLAVQTPDLQRQLSRLEKSQRGLSAAIVFAALSLAAVQLHLAGQSGLAAATGAGALLALVFLLFPR